MDYKNGKIYALRTHKGDEVYIGSTTQSLSKRFYYHKNAPNSTTARVLFKKYDDVYIELIELYPCESKQELCRREGEIQREHKERVNYAIAGQIRAEYNAANKDFIAERKKVHYEAYKEKILAKCKEYTQANQAEISERKQIRRAANQEAVNQRKREIYVANKEKILAQNKASRERNKISQ